MLQNKIVPKLDKVVTLKPEDLRRKAMALEVRPTPPGDAGVAYYQAPSDGDEGTLDATSNGTFNGTFDGTIYLNLDRVGDTFRKFETAALILHEGLPGHHYQYVARKVGEISTNLVIKNEVPR